MSDQTATSPTIELDDAAAARNLVEAYQRLTAQMSRVIVGQEDVIEQLLIAVLARGHCLLVGCAGTGQDADGQHAGQALHLSVQPHSVHARPDAGRHHGHRHYPRRQGDRRIVSCVFVRGPDLRQHDPGRRDQPHAAEDAGGSAGSDAGTQVTIGGQTYKLTEPFFVLATQNPIEQEGTYPLPEAQRDRFMFHVVVDYPDREQEREIINRTTSRFEASLSPVIEGRQIIEAQQAVRRVPVPDHVMDFVLDLVRRCRPRGDERYPWIADLVEWGPGPRAGQQLVLGAKVRALLQGRFHVTLDDVEALAAPVLRHRIVPTFNAEAEGLTVDAIVERLLKETPRGIEAKAM